MPAPIRIAVVGAGAFGRNHLRVLGSLASTTLLPLEPSSLPAEQGPAAALAAVVDPDPQARQAAADTYGIPAFSTVGDLLRAGLNLHAATVATPTVTHAEIAGQLLAAGLDVLIEKPLATTLAEADALLAQAASTGRILAAGHLERFNPAVTAAEARLTRPMFFEAHRLSVFTPRSLDVDVVLDLMIHDLDILLTFARSPVTEVRAVGLPILSRQTDIANVRLAFRSGAVANLTASRVSTEQIRKLRLFQPAEYLSLDYARQELLAITLDPTPPTSTPPQTSTSLQTSNLKPQQTPTPLQPPTSNLKPQQTPTPLQPPTSNLQPEQLPAPGLPQGSAPRSSPAQRSPSPHQTAPHPSAGLLFGKQALTRAEPLRLELQDFLAAIKTRQPPRVTGQAARDALALALEINRAIATHTEQAGLS